MKKKKIISWILMLALVVCSFCFNTDNISAATWKTGNLVQLEQQCGYTTVKLTNKKKDAYITVKSYKPNNKSIKNDLHITLRTTSGKWICEFDWTTNKKIRLGNDHSAYRVEIRRNFVGSRAWEACYTKAAKYWSLGTTTNCSF